MRGNSPGPTLRKAWHTVGALVKASNQLSFPNFRESLLSSFAELVAAEKGDQLPEEKIVTRISGRLLEE